MEFNSVMTASFTPIPFNPQVIILSFHYHSMLLLLNRISIVWAPMFNTLIDVCWNKNGITGITYSVWISSSHDDTITAEWKSLSRTGTLNENEMWVEMYLRNGGDKWTWSRRIDWIPLDAIWGISTSFSNIVFTLQSQWTDYLQLSPSPLKRVNNGRYDITFQLLYEVTVRMNPWNDSIWVVWFDIELWVYPLESLIGIWWRGG